MTKNEKWAVVTGASRGIGKAIALRLAADGYALELVATNEELLDAVCAEITDAGGSGRVRVCDLGDRPQLDALTSALRDAHPKLHVLVNNAGIADLGHAHELDRSWDAVLEVDLRAPFELCRALEPTLSAAAGASIVNVGSMGGTQISAGIVSYSAAKAGLTRALAVEWGPKQIRVNAVAPGSIRTEMFDDAHPEERKRALAEAHPLRRVASPHEVASVVSFLCGPDASFVSGAVIPVDAGLSTKLAIVDLIEL